MQENSSFLSSPRVTGRIAPCLKGRGGSPAGGGSARVRGEPGTPHQAQHAHGSANDTSEAAVHCHGQERNWFMLDSSTAGWPCVCCDPGGEMAVLLNLKDAHSSSHGTQNLSGVFHKWERHPGTAIRVTNRTSSWPGDSF